MKAAKLLLTIIVLAVLIVYGIEARAYFFWAAVALGAFLLLRAALFPLRSARRAAREEQQEEADDYEQRNAAAARRSMLQWDTSSCPAGVCAPSRRPLTGGSFEPIERGERGAAPAYSTARTPIPSQAEAMAYLEEHEGLVDYAREQWAALHGERVEEWGRVTVDKPAVMGLPAGDETIPFVVEGQFAEAPSPAERWLER